jgi:hypothetical protein
MCLHAARIAELSILLNFCCNETDGRRKRLYSINSPKSKHLSPFKNNSINTHPNENISIAGVNSVAQGCDNDVDDAVGSIEGACLEDGEDDDGE